MGDAVAMVPALAGQAELTVGVEVEVGAEGDQLAYRLGALADQRAHGVQVAGAGTGHQGVALVLGGGVAGTERRRDAALRPLGRARVEHVLGHDQHAVDTAPQPQRGRQPGDAGPDHHDVGRDRPAGFGCRQATDHAGCAERGESTAGGYCSAGRATPGRSRRDVTRPRPA